LFQRRFVRVDDGAVLGDVLLFDGGNLRVSGAGHRVRKGGTDVHVVIPGLVFTGHDGEGVHLGDRRGRLAIVVIAQVVCRMALFICSASPADDVRTTLQDVVAVSASNPLHERRVVVDLVEALQQAPAVPLREIVVWLVLGNGGGRFHGHLLVGDGRFE